MQILGILSRRRQPEFIDLREDAAYRGEGQVCGVCGGRGRLVWADLVAQKARHECVRCGRGWVDAGAETRVASATPVQR